MIVNTALVFNIHRDINNKTQCCNKLQTLQTYNKYFMYKII